jgi:diguanylate cyclase (GGDEF)-like protein
VTSGNRVLLAGDALARPVGLERALTHAGFLLTEAPRTGGPELDAILVTLAGSSDVEIRAAVAVGGPDSPPVVVVVSGADLDAPAAALALGAADALAAPVHLPELCARLEARIRDRRRRREVHSGPAQPPLGASPIEATTEPSAPRGGQLFDHRLREEFERARRYSLSFSLVLLDLGPREADGEGGLTTAAERLRQGLRLPDFLSRYSSGELAIILPETGIDGARRSVIRLREQLGRQGPNGKSEQPPVSAGIVTYPHPAVAQADDMFALVEAALARGKAQVAERVGVAE